MKKSMQEPLRLRKLVVRREVIAALAPPQLSQIAGGSSGWPPSCVSQTRACDADPA